MGRWGGEAVESVAVLARGVVLSFGGLLIVCWRAPVSPAQGHCNCASVSPG